MRILVVDYKMNNLGSIRRALEICGAQVIVSDEPLAAREADKVVLPGIGVFADAIKILQSMGWVDELLEVVALKKKPILGICLGMQLLASKGYEGGETPGLNFIQGEVKKMVSSEGERIPHVGWNEVCIVKQNNLFKGIAQDSDFYFVHSYNLIPTNQDDVIGHTCYCGTLTAAVNFENVFGVQFHPEKSGQIGFKLLKNFVELA